MTIYQMNILLWYACRAGDYPYQDAPIWRETIDAFLSDDLLRVGNRVSSDPTLYHISERGLAYTNALQRVPLPQQQWVVEWPKDDL